MKFVSILAILAGLFGCKAPEPQILDGPGTVYIDSEHRTEYANVLPFDELESRPYWAVAYLGSGEIGEENREKYIGKLFSDLPEESRAKIKHYDFGGDSWYLVIPRYPDENDIIQNGDEDNAVCIQSGEAFTVQCGTDVKICMYTHGGHEFTPQIDENGKLICTEDVWDITEYKQ